MQNCTKIIGGVVKLAKDLKSTVEDGGAWKEKCAKGNWRSSGDSWCTEGYREVIVANSDAIKRIKKEMKELIEKKKTKEVVRDALENKKKGMAIQGFKEKM